MAERVILDLGYYSETKNSILVAATKLFAINGFYAVSTRDIAKAVGMNIASIYYYYESKEALLLGIFENVEKGYRHYYDWLISESRKVDSPEELLDIIFSRELLEMSVPLVCQGISLAVKEQHSNKHARKFVVEVLTEYSIKSIQAGFDGLIERGIIKPFETKALATLLVFSAIAINDLRLHESTGEELTLDYMEMYTNLKKFVAATLRNNNDKHQHSEA